MGVFVRVPFYIWGHQRKCLFYLLSLIFFLFFLSLPTVSLFLSATSLFLVSSSFFFNIKSDSEECSLWNLKT